MSDTPLDSLTGKDASTLNVAQLAERLAMERALREQGNVFLRELVADKEAALNKALLLQAREYERRLDSLNGEAARLAKVLAASIPREIFDAYKETQAAAARLVLDTLAEERGARAGGQRLMAVMLFLVALAGLILKFIPVGS